VTNTRSWANLMREMPSDLRSNREFLTVFAGDDDGRKIAMLEAIRDDMREQHREFLRAHPDLAAKARRVKSWEFRNGDQAAQLEWFEGEVDMWRREISFWNGIVRFAYEVARLPFPDDPPAIGEAQQGNTTADDAPPV
jgi:hypothetical protein